MNTETKATHTPGPWDVEGSNGDFLIGSRAHWIARLFHRQSHMPGTTSLAPEPREVMANAHLIAAAPLLLEALETAREWLAFLESDDERAMPVGRLLLVEQALDSADAAIAAARGEA